MKLAMGLGGGGVASRSRHSSRSSWRKPGWTSSPRARRGVLTRSPSSPTSRPRPSGSSWPPASSTCSPARPRPSRPARPASTRCPAAGSSWAWAVPGRRSSRASTASRSRSRCPGSSTPSGSAGSCGGARRSSTRAGPSRSRCPPARAPGLGKPLNVMDYPVRPDIPIWWAALTPRAVEKAAELADGWIPIHLIPEKIKEVWGGQLQAGLARRGEGRLPVRDQRAVVNVAIGEDLPVQKLRDEYRPAAGPVRGRHGRPRGQLLQRHGRRVRLPRRGQGHPGPLPGRQEGRGRRRGPRRVAGEGPADRPQELRAGSASPPTARPASPRSRSARSAARTRSRLIEQMRELADEA